MLFLHKEGVLLMLRYVCHVQHQIVGFVCQQAQSMARAVLPSYWIVPFLELYLSIDH
jgi:hypothetical protein